MNIKHVHTNAKVGANVDVGEKTLIVGRNGSGKSTIINAIELALTSRVSDIAGRTDVAREADVMQLAPQGAALHAEVIFDDGSGASYRVEGSTAKAKKAVAKRPIGIDHDEVTADGKFSLERIECQAACTHAPAMTVNWEFMDLVTPESAVSTIDKLANGETVESTRGPVVGTWRDTARVLAGFDDGKTDEGVAADELMLAGLKRAKELGMTAPNMTNGASHAEAGQ